MKQNILFKEVKLNTIICYNGFFQHSKYVIAVKGQANPLNDLAVDVLIMSLKDDLPSLIIPASQISNLHG
ncbi:MAG: hypothetical protein GY820_17805 [Gammaproteobacteria bacterium]|nr:hypothetical protein [Gammaproteobacteria bacterium]